ncbi:hemolysin family protein [Natronoarchaeum mannanilyticum]|uniref:Hemolysin family protein n=1 Tax=Natronoarchaeum mannanilyticum TaxID=926360 RepID=A0AAV3TBF7_9EURY
MVDFVFSAARLLLALALVALNGFFVASEFAFVKVRATRVDAMVEEGGKAALRVQEAMDNLDDYLAVTQLGITLSSLGLGWAGEPAVAAVIEPVLGAVLPEGVVHIVAVAIGFSIITFLHVVFGELAPKTLAIQEAERIALLVSAPMKVFYYLFIPGLVVFNGTANYFTGLIGVSPASESEETHSEEELLTIVGRSGEHGAIDVEEVEMIESVFDLGDTIAREVMTPRPDVATVAARTPLSELRSIAATGPYTRYVVVDEETDEPVEGFVHAKDVLRAIEEMSAAADDGESEPLARDLVREVLVVPETRRIDDILSEFQARNVQMAVVIDEWGALEGILTIEDVLEELVGEITDEFDLDDHEPSMVQLEDGAWELDGGVPIDRVNERLGAAFANDEYDTIGGVVLGALGSDPATGDRVELDGYAATVEAVDGTRISTVVLRETDAGDGSDDVLDDSAGADAGDGTDATGSGGE